MHNKRKKFLSLDSTKLATFMKVKEKLSLVSRRREHFSYSYFPKLPIFSLHQYKKTTTPALNYKMLLHISCILILILQSQSFVIKFNTEASSHKASNSEIFDAEEAAYFDAHDLSDAGVESAAMER